jgi:hypothetical protein
VPQDADVGRIRWAYLLAAVAAAEAVVAIGGAVVMRLGVRDAVGSYLVTNLAIGLSFAPCGFLVARHRPDNATAGPTPDGGRVVAVLPLAVTAAAGRTTAAVTG